MRHRHAFFHQFYPTHEILTPGCKPLPVMGLAEPRTLALYERRDWPYYRREPPPPRWVYDERDRTVRLLGRPVPGARLRRIREAEE